MVPQSWALARFLGKGISLNHALLRNVFIWFGIAFWISQNSIRKEEHYELWNKEFSTRIGPTTSKEELGDVKFQEGNWRIREGATSLGSQACPTPNWDSKWKTPGIALRSYAPVYSHLHGSTTTHLGVALGLLLFQTVISSEDELDVGQRRAKASWIPLALYVCCNPI